MKRLVFFLILLSSIKVLAAPEVYSVGVEDYEDYPFQYTRNGEFDGSLKKILDEFAKSEGIIFEYKPFKSENLYRNFLSGKLDFKFPDNHIWSSSEKAGFNIYYSDLVTHYIDGIFVREEDIKKTMKQLKVFGSNKIDDIHQILHRKRKKKKIEIDSAKSCAELISKLEKKEIDAIFCNYDVMKYLLKNSVNQGRILFNPELLYIDNYFYLSTMKYPEVIERFNIWIKNNRQFIENISHEKD